jgi:hypothetical protein
MTLMELIGYKMGILLPVGSALDVRGDILDFLDFDFSNVENIIDQNLVRPESYTGAVEPVVSFSIREDGGHRTFPLQLNQLHVFTTYRSIAFLAYDLLSFSGLRFRNSTTRHLILEN